MTHKKDEHENENKEREPETVTATVKGREGKGGKSVRVTHTLSAQVSREPLPIMRTSDAVRIPFAQPTGETNPHGFTQAEYEKGGDSKVTAPTLEDIGLAAVEYLDAAGVTVGLQGGIAAGQVGPGAVREAVRDQNLALTHLQSLHREWSKPTRDEAVEVAAEEARARSLSTVEQLAAERVRAVKEGDPSPEVKEAAKTEDLKGQSIIDSPANKLNKK